MTVGQSEEWNYLALRLLYQEPRVERKRRRNKEEVIMDWATLLIIETVIALLGLLSVHFIWR
jgi:hypothetical protein